MLQFNLKELKQREAALCGTIRSLQNFNNGPINRRKSNSEGLVAKSRPHFEELAQRIQKLDKTIPSLHTAFQPAPGIFNTSFNQLSGVHAIVHQTQDESDQKLRLITDIQSPELQSWFANIMEESNRSHIKKAQRNILTNYIRLMMFAETAFCLLEQGVYLWYKMLGKYAAIYQELGNTSLVEEYNKIEFKP